MIPELITPCTVVLPSHEKYKLTDFEGFYHSIGFFEHKTWENPTFPKEVKTEKGIELRLLYPENDPKMAI